MKAIKTNRERLIQGLLILLGLAGLVFLAATLETGRVHAQNSAFTFLGLLSKVITPNGDALNDNALICVDNPRASGVSGTIYDLRGGKVAGMGLNDTAGVIANCPGASLQRVMLIWDGKSGGRAVSSGIYIYQVQAEGQTITGTVMVAR